MEKKKKKKKKKKRKKETYTCVPRACVCVYIYLYVYGCTFLCCLAFARSEDERSKKGKLFFFWAAIRARGTKKARGVKYYKLYIFIYIYIYFFFLSNFLAVLIIDECDALADCLESGRGRHRSRSVIVLVARLRPPFFDHSPPAPVCVCFQPRQTHSFRTSEKINRPPLFDSILSRYCSLSLFLLS